jgi:hypothetical protein
MHANKITSVNKYISAALEQNRSHRKNYKKAVLDKNMFNVFFNHYFIDTFLITSETSVHPD